ncbi:hypothetical protein I601_1329 [Nocardioides dokdonensis FR1436]|uniref:Uncharacterized protein n=1 Tax=Nocardioides dokdonensis FR1436 TaxID=1300347 RepID=A0A1A9GHK3_9ACTN|nr:hypothetical protein [Nocardioides dokdonensis]ANH37768.1 hypothetical protein I601_1329 [Nocardioides dokdonensis FR1436]
MTPFVGRLSAGQWVVRALVAVLPTAAGLCTLGAGEAPSAWFVALVLVLGVGWAVFPESAAGATVLVLVIAWWGIGLRDGLDPWALPAALALLTAHVAATIAAYGPAGMPVDPALARLWARRAGLVYLAAPLTFALAVAVRDVAPPAGIWVAGLAAVLGASTVASVLLTQRD